MDEAMGERKSPSDEGNDGYGGREKRVGKNKVRGVVLDECCYE